MLTVALDPHTESSRLQPTQGAEALPPSPDRLWSSGRLRSQNLAITRMTSRTIVPLVGRSLRVLPLLFLVIWIAHFSLSYSFGLYEDDYSHISPWMTSEPSILMSILAVNFTVWPQGRPLHFSFPKLFGYLGFQAAGLQGIYVIAAIILTLNAFLFYLLLKRVGSDTFALLGGLAFCLFPADTTRAFLTHAIGYQPSFTFLLIALHLYFSDLRKVSYVVILGALLTFEAGLAAFLVSTAVEGEQVSKAH